MTPAALAKACGGRVARSGGPALTLTTDSRAANAATCFVAMRGAARDGHDYVADALARGACGAIVEKGCTQKFAPQEGQFIVRVPDSGDALMCVAAEHRRRHEARIIGITGSCGKTTTKDMLAHVLAASMPTVASPKSYNNHVGVPLSLVQILPETRAAVVEIGTNAPGEIAALTSVASPDIGIVTCVSEAHLAGLGSLEGIAREKASLLEGLADGGIAIVNGDDRSCRAMAEAGAAAGRHRSVFVSLSGEADWFATDVRFHGLGTAFRLQGEHPVCLPRLGSHNVYNALLAIAAAVECGVPLDEVLAALASLEPSRRRLERRRCGDFTIVDDSYNMNPTSARAALSALDGLVRDGRKIVVFGEMLELGDASERLHVELGADVASSGVDVLVTVGARAAAIADGAVAAGFAAERVDRVADAAGAFDALIERIQPDDVVLFKASRGVALDRLVDRLERERTAAGGGDGAALTQASSASGAAS